MTVENGTMKRRSFLSLAAGTLCALGAGALAFFKRPAPEFIFVWVGEPSEVFAAPDLATLNKWLDAGESRECFPCKGRGVYEGTGYAKLDGHQCNVCEGVGRVVDQPLLTPGNKGQEWGDADAEEKVKDEETGAVMTFREVVDGYRGTHWFRETPVAQIATWYN